MASGESLPINVINVGTASGGGDPMSVATSPNPASIGKKTFKIAPLDGDCLKVI